MVRLVAADQIGLIQKTNLRSSFSTTPYPAMVYYLLLSKAKPRAFRVRAYRQADFGGTNNTTFKQYPLKTESQRSA